MKDDIIKARIDRDHRQKADKLKKMLGLAQDSDLIRALIDFAYNVTHKLFGGNIGQFFLRKTKPTEELKFIE